MPTGRWLHLALIVSALAGVLANAESALRLPYPARFGTIPASAYDPENQERIGDASLVIEELPNGNIRLSSRAGFEGGARTIAQAELEPVEAGVSLRPVREESRSFDPEGNSLSVLSIDHATARASCLSPKGKLKELALPAEDRVTNVPLNLLFIPLARGEVDHIQFQLMTCGFGARLVDFEAAVASNGDGSQNGSGHVVEIRYKPDLGFISFLAKSMIPKLSIWFDPQASSPWLGHRIPLYSKGPEVFVIRDGIPREWIPKEH